MYLNNNKNKKSTFTLTQLFVRVFVCIFTHKTKMVFSLTSSFNKESMLLTDMFGVVALWFIVFLFLVKNTFVYVYKPETTVD